VSQVESINEVDKLYTKQEMKINKISGRINETHTQMKMSWVLSEVDTSKEESKLDLMSGNATKKTNPSNFGTGIRTFSRNTSKSRNSKGRFGAEEAPPMEAMAKKFMQEKEEFEDFVDEFYDINKMRMEASTNLF
jgi:hypothetical protein